MVGAATAKLREPKHAHGHEVQTRGTDSKVESSGLLHCTASRFQ